MTDKEIDEMEAGREMDALIAEKVLGWHLDSHLGFYHWLDSDNQPRELIADFEPSTDIGAAWLVVEKLTTTTKQWFHYEQSSATYTAIFQNDAYEGYDAEAEADTAPLAICRAALKAVTGAEA